ncbi:unnamed protein product [Urochloa decumbens]|uniref:non-specific serine/threonine protein kinase n=1 Tax=Urochloa decumbens TaxID=240449 RepID=A0ABC9F1H0_9POAL
MTALLQNPHPNFMKRMYLLLLLGLALTVVSDGSDGAGGNQFVYSCFSASNLTVEGTATVTPDGLLQLTNGTHQLKGHAFYPAPLNFSTMQSFSVNFVFAIVTDENESSHSNDGMAFFLAPSKNFSDALPAQFLGLLNPRNNGDPENRLFAVEIDTVFNSEFEDINDNHVGININSLTSLQSYVPRFYDSRIGWENMPLSSSKAMQVWVDYVGKTNTISVTFAPLEMVKPLLPQISTTYNLSTVITEIAYVGFSAATGTFPGTKHYVLGWSFGMDGPAPAINMIKLPNLPHVELKAHYISKAIQIISPISTTIFFLAIGTIVLLLVRRWLSNNVDLLEDWEIEFGPHRFQIIKGIASGLLYLHAYWEQVVIHRDIKARNVLLDEDMNGRLGDFGLARLYNHGTDPQTTRMAGTFGYIAPELSRTGKASPLTDVFAFGILLLEIACGRRPIEGRAQDTPFILVDWVTEHWHKGSLMEAVDRRLQSDYNVDEACVALKLGLWCSHPLPNARPSMQQVMLYLEGQHLIPEFVPMDVACQAGFDTLMISHQSSVGTMSGLSGGR